MSPDSLGSPPPGVSRMPPAGGGQIRCRVETVTPEVAGRWLAAIRRPRRLYPTTVNAFSREMAADAWKLNAAPIIFDDAGELLDGQLRLAACVQAGRAFRTLLVDGIKSEDFLSIDQFRRRKLKTILDLRSEASSLSLCSLLNGLHCYYFNPADIYLSRPSPQELLRMLDARPSIRLDALYVRTIKGALSVAAAGALFHLGCRVDEAYTRRFFAELGDDRLGERANPAVLLRQTVRQFDGVQRGHIRNELLALAIKAWNAGYGGRTIRHLEWRQRDPQERLPALAGLAADDGDDLIRVRGAAEPAAAAALEVSVELVSPEMAAALLANSPVRRELSAKVVRRYADDMATGRWALNGQTLKIGRSGQLLDGHHRCNASLIAGCSFATIVARHVDDDIQDTLDLGSNRQYPLILYSRGETLPISLGAALRFLLKVSKEGGGDEPPTNAELERTLLKYPAIRDSAHKAQVFKISKMLEGSAAIALHFSFSQQDAGRADTFFARLNDGAGLAPHSPILVLRERLIESQQSPTTRLSRDDKIVLTIRAWQAFLAGREVPFLRLCSGKEREELYSSFSWFPPDPPDPTDRHRHLSFEPNKEDLDEP